MPHAKKATTPKTRGKDEKQKPAKPVKSAKPAKATKHAKPANAKDAGKTAGTYKKTDERVTLPGQKRARVVYVGLRNKNYIKKGDTFILLKIQRGGVVNEAKKDDLIKQVEKLVQQEKGNIPVGEQHGTWAGLKLASMLDLLKKPNNDDKYTSKLEDAFNQLENKDKNQIKKSLNEYLNNKPGFFANFFGKQQQQQRPQQPSLPAQLTIKSQAEKYEERLQKANQYAKLQEAQQPQRQSQQPQNQLSQQSQQQPQRQSQQPQNQPQQQLSQQSQQQPQRQSQKPQNQPQQQLSQQSQQQPQRQSQQPQQAQQKLENALNVIIGSEHVLGTRFHSSYVQELIDLLKEKYGLSYDIPKIEKNSINNGNSFQWNEEIRNPSENLLQLVKNHASQKHEIENNLFNLLQKLIEQMVDSDFKRYITNYQTPKQSIPNPIQSAFVTNRAPTLNPGRLQPGHRVRIGKVIYTGYEEPAQRRGTWTSSSGVRIKRPNSEFNNEA